MRMKPMIVTTTISLFLLLASSASSSSLNPSASPTFPPTSSIKKLSSNIVLSDLPSDVPSHGPTWNPSVGLPSNIPTLHPSEYPSWSLSEEPNCASTTNGPLQFDRHVAIRVTTTKNITTSTSTQDHLSFVLNLEAAVFATYQQIIDCPKKGSFRMIDQVSYVYENLSAATTTSREYIFRISGKCEGCSAEALWLFQETAGLPYHEDEVTGMVIGEGEPCSCRIPEQSLFDDSLMKNLNHSEIVVLEVVELVESNKCVPVQQAAITTASDNTTNTQEDTETINSTIASLEETEVRFYTTTVVVRFSRGDILSELNSSHVDKMKIGFLEAYHAMSSLVSGNCDLYHRTITSVDIEPNQGIGRRHLAERGRNSSNLRKRPFTPGLFTRNLEQYTAAEEEADGIEVLFIIEGHCRGCGGLLFGEVTESIFVDESVVAETSKILDASSSCMCSTNPMHYGLDTDSFQGPLQARMTQILPMGVEIDEVVEVNPVPCSIQPGTFEAYIVLEVNTDINSTTGRPLDGEFDALQIAFVTSYNRLARDFCDPYRRRLTEAKIERVSGEAGGIGPNGDGGLLALELKVSGTCLDCDNKNITLYDSISVLTGITVEPDQKSRRRELHKSLEGQEEMHPLSRDIQGSFRTRSKVVDLATIHKLGRDLGLDETTGTCYCDVNAISDQGASEPEVVAAFSDLVSTLDLPTIKSVADCKFVTLFQSSVLLRFRGSPETATEEELATLGQGFIDAYNRINSGHEVCDRQFRQLVDFRVEANITVNEEYLDGYGGIIGGDEAMIEEDGTGRRIMTWTKIGRRGGDERDLKALLSDSDSNTTTVTSEAPNGTTNMPTVVSSYAGAPTASPSISISPKTIDVLLFVSGTCRGCARNFGLFDQVPSTRRRGLQEESTSANVDRNTDEIQLDFLTSTGSCYCPPEAVQAEPSEDVIVQAFAETVENLRNDGVINFVEEIEQLEEVAVVQCVLETNQFETTMTIDFYAYFNEIRNSDIDAIRVSFNATYNRLSESYCDALFRRSEDIGKITYEEISAPNSDGVSRVRFYLNIEGRCQGCSDGDPALLPRYTKEGRILNVDDDVDLCFCDSSTVANRAPTEDEFEEEYSVAWKEFQRARRFRQLKGGKSALVALAGVGEELPTPSPTSIPSGLPSIAPSASTKPSRSSTMNPTESATPSDVPTAFPSTSDAPSLLPSAVPSISQVPSNAPTPVPMLIPSQNPSTIPSGYPSEYPSEFPSSFPSMPPSSMPSLDPSLKPSLEPPRLPSASLFPSLLPSLSPSIVPTSDPSSAPSAMHSQSPSASLDPSSLPSRYPSTMPSLDPSSVPSLNPSLFPSCNPSSLPSREPSLVPSLNPSYPPSGSPSSWPSLEPSLAPSSSPSLLPSGLPSTMPSIKLSAAPSLHPSTYPSSHPSSMPSLHPSLVPSVYPSHVPSSDPSTVPSRLPSGAPSLSPSFSPSAYPSRMPTPSPSLVPSSRPSRSTTPSKMPTWAPSSIPSSKPSGRPTMSPTATATKRVFLTSLTYNGDLGGVSGADAKCQLLADVEMLGGTYLAWISDDDPATAPANRFTRTSGNYVTVGPASDVIANGWDDLTDGTLHQRPNRDEKGTLVIMAHPWTGTLDDGTAEQALNCGNWQVVDNTSTGRSGSINTASGPNWSLHAHHNCFEGNRLYCFEQ